MIRVDDVDFKTYRIAFKDLVNDFDINHKDAYKEISQAINSLRNKDVFIYTDTAEGTKYVAYKILASAGGMVDNGKYMDVDFHPDLRPHLLQLKREFLSYEAINIAQIQSSSSVRMYELLKQYQTIGERKFDVDELKEILLLDDKYSLYGSFKNRIIKKAQKDLLEYTDICFDTKEIKDCRKVKAIKFTIKPNLKVTDARNTPKEIQVNADAIELYEMIKMYKSATVKTTTKWLKKYSIDHIKARIIHVRTQPNIANHIAYIASILDKELPKEQQTILAKVIQKPVNENQIKEQAIFNLQEAKHQALVDFLYSKLDETLATSIFNKLEQSTLHDPDAPLRIDMLKVMAKEAYIYTDTKGSFAEVQSNLANNFQFMLFAIRFITEQYPKEIAVIEKNFDDQISQVK